MKRSRVPSEFFAVGNEMGRFAAFSARDYAAFLSSSIPAIRFAASA